MASAVVTIQLPMLLDTCCCHIPLCVGLCRCTCRNSCAYSFLCLYWCMPHFMHTNICLSLYYFPTACVHCIFVWAAFDKNVPLGESKKNLCFLHVLTGKYVWIHALFLPPLKEAVRHRGILTMLALMVIQTTVQPILAPLGGNTHKRLTKVTP